MEFILTIEGGDRRITHCAWAPWKISAETGRWDIAMCVRPDIQPTAESTLACGLSNGNVILIDVTQQLLLATPGPPSGLEVATVIRDENVAAQDKRIITVMKWISRQDGTVGDLMLCT